MATGGIMEGEIVIDERDLAAAIEKLVEDGAPPEALTMMQFLIDLIQANQRKIIELQTYVRDQILTNEIIFSELERLKEGKNETN